MKESIMESSNRVSDRVTPSARTAGNAPINRIKSQDLFQQMRELEIDHGGRIYKLRLTQLNKLILTA
jgi:hemin uptake protein HemP